METQNKISMFALLSILLLALIIGSVRAQAGIDNSIYADLLAKHVKDGVVNYAGFKSDEGRLDQYLKILESIDPDELSRNEQYAFYINAYNAWTIKMILSAYPGVKSIKDLGNLFKSPWKKKFVRINGETITLDDIEHKILRPRFKDARVHFAINCAAKSCPPLISEPYQGNTLDQQLDNSASDFLNNSGSYKLSGTNLQVSKIFDWFNEDFDQGVLSFYLKYAKGDLKKELETNKSKLKITYLSYDWSLNGN